MNVLTVLGLVLAFNCKPARAASTIVASASVNKMVFVLGKDEIDFVFTARNDSKSPVGYNSIRRDSVLFINGRELKDSGIIFGNGPGPVGQFLQPGETTQFGYRLTAYFSKPGNYTVVWKGADFQAKPVHFRVAKTK